MWVGYSPTSFPDPGARSSTSTVPSGVPSLFQRPIAVRKSQAAKKRVPPTFVRPRGLVVSGWNSGRNVFSATVPSGVPSLFHTVYARTPPGSTTLCRKKSVPFTSVRSERKPPPVKLWMMLVPAGVPSVFQSAGGAELEVAKNMPSPAGVNSPGNELVGPATRSANSCVPSAVPSVTHGSYPSGPFAAKNSFPSNGTTRVGCEPIGVPSGFRRGSRSFSRNVPDSVPSLVHSSVPAAES
jgi:hypothetical protein